MADNRPILQPPKVTAQYGFVELTDGSAYTAVAPGSTEHLHVLNLIITNNSAAARKVSLQTIGGVHKGEFNCPAGLTVSLQFGRFGIEFPEGEAMITHLDGTPNPDSVWAHAAGYSKSDTPDSENRLW